MSDKPPTVPSSAADPGPKPAGIVLRLAAAAAGPGQGLLDATGLRVATSSDFRLAPKLPADLGGAELLYFQRFGLAIVRADPDRSGALVQRLASGGWLRSVRAERRYRALLGQAPAAAGAARADWGLAAIKAHSSRWSGAGIRVALLDTGLDSAHPDFQDRPVTRRLLAGGSVADDVSGHGTACAGVACGPLAPQGVARYGVAHGAAIHAAKVVGDDDEATDLALIAGIDWALEQGCQVISMPLGGAPNDDFEPIGRACLDAGALVIAAAGNGSQRPGFIAPVVWPANAGSIMAVGALSRALRAAPTSSGGPQVDIAAPGVGILSARRGGGHERVDGTSIAASFAVGVAALLAQSDARLRGRALWRELLRLARPIKALPRDLGCGLLQAPR